MVIGCVAVNIKSSLIKQIDKTHGFLIKRSKYTSLLQGPNLKNKSTLQVSITFGRLHLTRKHQFCDIPTLPRYNSLYSRCSSICEIKDISLMRYTFDD